MSSPDVVRIPQHAHCWICGKAMAYGEKTCSPECRTKYEETQRKRRTMTWILYGSMAVAVGILVWNVLRAGG